MKALTSRVVRTARCAVMAGVVGCAARAEVPASASAKEKAESVGEKLPPAAEIVIESPKGIARPPYHFNAEDDKLLDEVQRGAFLFLWNACSPATGMVVDRTSEKFASVAGVGFQLAALPVGVERGWVTRAEAEARAIKILSVLEANPTNRKSGMFYHFLDERTASPVASDAVSTVDSALLFAGMMVASSYFEGEVRERGDRICSDANWSAFVEQAPAAHEAHMKGFVSLGWKPDDWKDPQGKGRLIPYYWADPGDEHRLVMLLAGAGPKAEHSVDPMLYYRLRRPLGDDPASGLHVFLPWSGALFTNIFANCFINYAAMGPDNPAAMGVEHRPRVDWWENSRRAVMMHRAKCVGASGKFPNFGENSWGLTACDGPKGYLVPGVYPKQVVPPDYRVDLDYVVFAPKDDFGGGVIAPYGAGCSVMFMPEEAVAALRHYRGLKARDGSALVWREPVGVDGGSNYGFLDAFNAPAGYVARDYVAIDQGPLVLAIENARTGKVWGWFHAHPTVIAATKRLGFSGLSPK